MTLTDKSKQGVLLTLGIISCGICGILLKVGIIATLIFIMNVIVSVTKHYSKS